MSDGADMLAAAGIPTEGAGGLWLAGMAADGTVQWVRRFGPDSRDLRRLQVCFDPAGSYYALWWAQEGAFSVTKFGPTGQEVWSRSVFISTSLLHSGLAVTPDGGLLIAGTVHDQSALPTLQWGETTLSFPDYSFGFILKLDSIGNLLWTAQPEGVGRIESLASDKLGNAYVAYELSDYNPGLAKFSPSGEQLWSRQGVDLSIGGAVPFPRVAVDAVGDCYFTGTFWKSDIGKMQFGDIVLSTTARAEMFLVKYSTDGDLLWATQSRGMEADDGDGGRFSDTRLSAIQPSPSGGFVLTGTIAGWVWFGNKQLIGPGPSGWDTFVVQFSDAPPPPPELQVARSNQGLVLSWPATAQGFRLQAAETLSAATAWNPLSTVPVLAGNRYTVSVPIEQAPRFFRLVKP